MVTIFEENFDDLSQWNPVGPTPPVLSTENPYNGVTGMKSTLPSGSVSGTWSSLVRSIAGNGDHINARAENVMIAVAPTQLNSELRLIYLSEIVAGTLVAACGIGRNSSGELRFFTRIRNNLAFETIWGGLASVNTNYTLELEAQRGASDGYVNVYVNGELNISAQGLSNTDRNMNYIEVGMQTSYEVPTGVDYTAWLDALVVATEYIGPDSTPTPDNTITVVSSPELNVPVYIDDILVGNTPVTVAVSSGTHTVRVDEEIIR